MIWMMVGFCAVFAATGIGFLLAERLKLPSRAASRAMHSMGRNRKDKPNPLTLLMRELSGRLAGKLRLNDYRRAQLEADLRTGDMTQTPEQFVAENLVRAGTVAVLAVPVVFLSKFLALLLLVVAILLYRLGSMTLRKKIGARRTRIELELPRFVANIEKTLPHSRDVLAMLESYRAGAGEEFGRELDITVADMRSGNDEAALTRLEARVGSSALSDVVRGLIGILHGEDNSVYWANLSLKFSEAGRQNLREQAGKVPKRVRRLSLVLLGCFFLIYIVVIGEVLLNSLGGLFL